MSKNKILLIIPLLVITTLIISCWFNIFSDKVLANWRHYIALGLFLILMIFYFVSFKLAVIGTGFYLLLATANILSISAEIKTSWIRIGSLETPPINLLSFGLLILYLLLNTNTLIDFYIAYKENKEKGQH